MIPTPYYERRLFARTLDDEAQFAAWTEHLPEREELTPYHCGPHSLRSMRTAYELCGEPKAVLEIGFCIGYSSSIWFGLGAKQVVSVDNSHREQTLSAGQLMHHRHGRNFTLLLTDTKHLIRESWGHEFDLMFIDGGHEFEDVSADIAFGLKIKVPYFLFDDWFPKWGPGVQPAVEHHKLIPLAIIGNMALCVPETGWKNP